jgi:phospholipid/cholesterol/gamma-HCH transport system ATP-binding protein
MIIVRDLWKSYGKLQVLKGLNLDIYDGETLVILGRSGAGKSVLLKQIIGIESPDKGYVEVDGKRVTTKDRKSNVLKPMGMLFQGAALFDSMTIGENVSFYLRQHPTPLSEREINIKVAEALEMVDLAGVQDKMPSELSGGMRKRAALARLIIYRPQIVLYDEPTTGLDPITAMQINELINQTKKKLQATSIVVTHDMVSALKISNRLAFHHEGKIEHIAPTQEFLRSPDPVLRSFFQNATVDPLHFDSSKNPEG